MPFLKSPYVTYNNHVSFFVPYSINKKFVIFRVYELKIPFIRFSMVSNSMLRVNSFRLILQEKIAKFELSYQKKVLDECISTLEFLL